MVELNSLNENIGLRIKLARENAGLTQEQLAERIDKSLSCKLRHRPDGFAEQNGRGAERADTLTL